jgi:hypothetical protein
VQVLLVLLHTTLLSHTFFYAKSFITYPRWQNLPKMTSTIGDAVKREDTFVVTKIMQAHQIAKEKKGVSLVLSARNYAINNIIKGPHTTGSMV